MPPPRTDDEIIAMVHRQLARMKRAGDGFDDESEGER